MLPQPYRLRRPADVRRVRREGKAWRHPLVVLLAAPACGEREQDGRAPARFAFTASRAAGGAVQRNRAKRLLREAIRPHLPHLEPGWDCVVIARTETTAARQQEVSAALISLLRRSGLLAGVAGHVPAPEDL